ncbi:hypothetical protein KAU43_06275 [candidate division WOR-3 bacterium]|nr:hypothetical protein [candidate division WOR-3 bacterium]
MFTDKIEIKKPNDIRYGTTKIPYEQTFGEILALLSKHGCDQIATMKDGDIQKIAFVYQENPHIIKIPMVFVDNIYNEKIGIRLVKYYLEIILDWSKQKIIKFEDLMLGTRMVNIAGKSTTLKEAVDEIPPTQLFQGMLDSSKQLKDANQPMSMEDARCPKCKADNIDFITNPTPRSRKPYGYCRVCGHEWEVILKILPNGDE